jgi:hypothetical protein
MRIPVARIEVPSWHPDTLAETTSEWAPLLAEARQQGRFSEPIRVKKDGARYVLVDGRRRLCAARELNWVEIDAEVFDGTPGGHPRGRQRKREGTSSAPNGSADSIHEPRASGGALPSLPAPSNDIKTVFSDPRRRRLLRELAIFLHDERHVHDARIAQIFDLGDADSVRRLRTDERGLTAVALEPLPLHELPRAIELGLRECAHEGLLVREEVEHLFPLNERERLHLAAERALHSTLEKDSSRIRLKGTHWGPDYKSGLPVRLSVVGAWPDGRECTINLEEIPGLDRFTIGILRKAFLALSHPSQSLAVDPAQGSLPPETDRRDEGGDPIAARGDVA